MIPIGTHGQMHDDGGYANVGQMNDVGYMNVGCNNEPGIKQSDVLTQASACYDMQQMEKRLVTFI